MKVYKIILLITTIFLLTGCESYTVAPYDDVVTAIDSYGINSAFLVSEVSKCVESPITEVSKVNYTSVTIIYENGSIVEFLSNIDKMTMQLNCISDKKFTSNEIASFIYVMTGQDGVSDENNSLLQSDIQKIENFVKTGDNTKLTIDVYHVYLEQLDNVFKIKVIYSDYDK